MTDIDELLRQTLHAVADTTPDRRPVPQTHRWATIAAALVVGLGLSGVALLIHDDQPSSPATVPDETSLSSSVPSTVDPTTPTPTAAADPVLLAPPQDLAEYAVDIAGISPTSPGSVSGAVLSPAGTVFGISVYPDADGQPPPGWQTRQVGRYVVASGNEEGSQTHTVADQCTRIAVSSPPGSLTTAEVDALLAGLRIEAGGAVTVSLPEDWQPLPVGPETDRHELNFTASIGGIRHSFTLVQMLDTNVGPFLAPYRGTPTAETLTSGAPAWVVAGRDERTYLVFQDGPNAVLLGADNIAAGELITLQSRLVRQSWTVTSAQQPDAPGPSPTLTATVNNPGLACSSPTLTLDGS